MAVFAVKRAAQGGADATAKFRQLDHALFEARHTIVGLGIELAREYARRLPTKAPLRPAAMSSPFPAPRRRRPSRVSPSRVTR